MATFIPPELGLPRFTCPHCGAIAHQEQLSVHVPTRQWIGTGYVQGHVPLDRLGITRCQSCSEDVIWHRVAPDAPYVAIWPHASTAPEPHADMPPGVRAVYVEADEVNAVSPRAAAALLRLALQVLLSDLVPEHKKIDDAIGALVVRGLDVQVQQAMDVVRVIGNNAVHPGQVKLDEDASLVPALFHLLNLIVEQVVSRPKRTSELYDLLPQGARDAIKRRDAPK